MVITGVADRATDRIAHLVYLDAATPVNGQSLVDVAGPFIEVTPGASAVRRRRGLVSRRAPDDAALRRTIPTTSRGWTSG
jgi:hypothetical protein